ncbi:MAG: hypothetical protein ACYSWW_11115 [Planctomycetota bacterium]|jgi:hypothetical protein
MSNTKQASIPTPSEPVKPRLTVSIYTQGLADKPPQTVQISYEAWLIRRNVDASEKSFVATGI